MSELAKPAQANIDKMWAYARKYAEKSGTSLHPDVSVTETVVEGLARHIEQVGRPLCPCNFYPDPAAEANERCAVRLQGEHARVTVVQIAGVVARRIVCRVGSGDKLAAGQRFGMIRFGSRTDCYMPRTTEITVRVGESVRGGQTVIGVLK